MAEKTGTGYGLRSPKTGAERRRHPRVQMVVPMTYRAQVMGAAVADGQGTTYNVSEGGLYVKLDTSFDVGSVLEVAFSLPDDYGDVKLLCTVVRAGKNLAGEPIAALRTTASKHGSIQRIADFVSDEVAAVGALP